MTVLPQKSYYQVTLFMNAKPLKPSLAEYVVLKTETKNAKGKKNKAFFPLVSSNLLCMRKMQEQRALSITMFTHHAHRVIL